MGRSLVILGNAGGVKQWGEIGVGWGIENRNVTFNNSFEKLGCKAEEQGTIA